MTYVMPFQAITLEALAEVGGKNASLGELLRAVAPSGVRVPGGFALTAAAFTHVSMRPNSARAAAARASTCAASVTSVGTGSSVAAGTSSGS